MERGRGWNRLARGKANYQSGIKSAFHTLKACTSMGLLLLPLRPNLPNNPALLRSVCYMIETFLLLSKFTWSQIQIQSNSWIWCVVWYMLLRFSRWIRRYLQGLPACLWPCAGPCAPCFKRHQSLHVSWASVSAGNIGCHGKIFAMPKK